MFFLCTFLFLPNTTNAEVDVAGDTKGYLNDSKLGGYYSIGSDTYSKPVSLFDGNPENKKIDYPEFVAIKERLKNDNSPLAGKIQFGEIYKENSSNVSTFVYDPTPNDGKNKDSVNIAYATKLDTNGEGGNFYTALKPALKDSPEADEQLNIIDKAQGRAEGTTIREKNELYNAEQEQVFLQQKIDEDAKKIDDLKKIADNIKSNNGTDEQIKVVQAAIEAAEFEQSGQLNKYGVNQKLIKEKQKIADSYKNKVKEPGCGYLNFLSFDCILWKVAITTNIIFKLASFIAYLTGTLFDYSLELSVNSAEFLNKLGVVEITWSFIRDILNMTFIFILLFTAVQILIGNDTKYNARKILTNVVIFAILMNFSLFAAKIMVDGSNIVSLKIYEAMKSSSTEKNSSISLRVMNTVGLTGLYDVSKILTPDTLQAEGVCANNPASLITVSVLGTIFLTILILALGLAAILFLIRLVNIIFLFIRSPLWVWGYAVPGSSTMSAISGKWWAEMQHVLLFPIMYLLQILIAIIVFDKLASVQKNGDSFLSLICNPPVGVSGLGSSISLLAVFAIVIMFLMKAINYGVTNAGNQGTFGTGKLATTAANKFAGWQTKMTTGLAKKAGGISVGVANRGLSFAKDKTYNGVKRTSGLVTGLIPYKGEKMGERLKQGFLNPEIRSKERWANVLGKAAVLTGSTTLGKKADSLHQNAEKERKDIDTKRTKHGVEQEELLQKISTRIYKPDTQEEWESKNGKIGLDATKITAYKDHVKTTLKKQADARLGKGVIEAAGLTVDAQGRPVKHIDELMDKAVSQEEVKNSAGNVTGYKIKINNGNVDKVLEGVVKHHTTGVGAASIKIDKMGLWKPFRTKVAVAKLKVLKKSLETSLSNNSNEQAEKDLEAMIKKTEASLSEIPDETSIKQIIKDVANGAHIRIDREVLKKHKNLRKIDSLLHRYVTANTAQRSALDFNIHDEMETILTDRNKMSEKLIKNKNDLAKKAAAKEKEKEKNK